MINTLTIGCNYEFSDDGELWDEGFLISISHRVPLTYQSLDGDKKEWYSHIRPVNKKPVFTQAMADAKELPKVGMKCLINFPDIDNCWYEYIIDFIGKHTLIASCKDVEERFSHLDDVYIKPIDTRTDKEKAIDDLLDKSVIFCNKDNMRTCFKIAYDEWAAKSDE